MARFDRVIPPGQEGRIVANVDTKKFNGPISKGITVRTNDPEHRTASLHIRADVKTWIDVLPAWTARLNANLGEGTRKVLYLKNREPGTSLEVPFQVSDHQYVTPILEKIPPDDPEAGKGDYRLILELSPEAPVGPIEGKITLTTSSKRQHTLEIALTGKVNGPIAVFPAAVNLFSHRSSGRPDRLAGSIVLQARSETVSFQVESQEADDARIELVPVPDPQNRRHRISVRWTEPETKGDFSGTIRIRTTNPEMPRIEVPYRVRIL